jgi:hypothetical protein
MYGSDGNNILGTKAEYIDPILQQQTTGFLAMPSSPYPASATNEGRDGYLSPSQMDYTNYDCEHRGDS